MLLVSEIPISRQERIESGGLGRVEKLAVAKGIPSAGARFFNDMAVERPAQRLSTFRCRKGCASAHGRFEAAGCELEHRLHLLPGERELLHHFVDGHAIF